MVRCDGGTVSLKTSFPVFRLPLSSPRHLVHQPRPQQHRAHAAAQMQQQRSQSVLPLLALHKLHQLGGKAGKCGQAAEQACNQEQLNIIRQIKRKGCADDKAANQVGEQRTQR